MIPKIIHYCWFGKNQKSELIISCIESWKRLLPEYEIIEWNEDNFNVNELSYTRQAYEQKKWAFVSDYVRLYALYNYGGLYFDTDVEVLKPFDSFLDNKMFTGFETRFNPITAVMGSEKNNEIIKVLMTDYDKREFIKADGTLDLITNTVVISRTLIKKGILPNGKYQKLNVLTVYPQIYFSPNNISRIWNKPSSKSYSIHHFDGSWKDSIHQKRTLKFKLRRYIIGCLRNTIGDDRLMILRGKN